MTHVNEADSKARQPAFYTLKQQVLFREASELHQEEHEDTSLLATHLQRTQLQFELNTPVPQRALLSLARALLNLAAPSAGSESVRHAQEVWLDLRHRLTRTRTQ